MSDAKGLEATVSVASVKTDFMRHERMPADYQRDVNGKVSKAEMNRYLPRWRCATCGQWLLCAELHTVTHCAQRAALDTGDAQASPPTSVANSGDAGGGV